jgi:hypothetical protein
MQFRGLVCLVFPPAGLDESEKGVFESEFRL